MNNLKTFEYKGIEYNTKEVMELLEKYEKLYTEIKEELEYNQKYLDYSKTEDKRYKKISDKLLKLFKE